MRSFTGLENGNSFGCHSGYARGDSDKRLKSREPYVRVGDPRAERKRLMGLVEFAMSGVQVGDAPSPSGQKCAEQIDRAGRRAAPQSFPTGPPALATRGHVIRSNAQARTERRECRGTFLVELGKKGRFPRKIRERLVVHSGQTVGK